MAQGGTYLPRNGDAIIGRLLCSPHHLAHPALPGLDWPREPTSISVWSWRAGLPCRPLAMGLGASLLSAAVIAKWDKGFRMLDETSFHGGTVSGHLSASSHLAPPVICAVKVRSPWWGR